MERLLLNIQNRQTESATRVLPEICLQIQLTASFLEFWDNNTISLYLAVFQILLILRLKLTPGAVTQTFLHHTIQSLEAQLPTRYQKAFAIDLKLDVFVHCSSQQRSFLFSQRYACTHIFIFEWHALTHKQSRWLPNEKVAKCTWLSLILQPKDSFHKHFNSLSQSWNYFMVVVQH